MFKFGTYEVTQSGHIECLLIGLFDSVYVNGIQVAQGTMFKCDKVTIDVSDGDIVSYNVSIFARIYFTPFIYGIYNETMTVEL